MPRGKPRDGSKNPGGRPRKEFCLKTFEMLGEFHCEINEIAAYFRMDRLTLENYVKDNYNCTVGEAVKELRESGKAHFRRMQMGLAQKNAAMGIWLGKQLLGQRDPDRQPEKAQCDPNGLADAIKSLVAEVREDREVAKKLSATGE